MKALKYLTAVGAFAGNLAGVVNVAAGAHPIYESSVKTYFAQSPPIPQCEESLLDVLCHSIQLDPAELQAVSTVYDTILKSMSVPEHERLHRVREMRLAQNLTYDASYLARDHSLASKLTRGQNQLKALATLLVLSQAAANPGAGRMGKALKNVDAEVVQLLKNINLYDVPVSVRGEGGDYELTHLVQSLGLGGAKPLEKVSEVLLGFISSRAMGKVLEAVFGPVDTAKTAKAVTVSFTGGSSGFGQAACTASDYSLMYDFDPVWCTCAVVDIFGYAMACGLPSSSIDCGSLSTDSPVPDDICTLANGTAIDPTNAQVSLDLRLEKTFDVATTPAKEAHLYYFLYRAIQATYSYNDAAFCGATDTNPTSLLPGWQNALEVRLMEEGDPLFELNHKTSSIPAVIVEQRYVNDAPVCDFVVLERGTSSSYEWMLNMDYKANPASESGSADAPIMVDGGYNKMTAAYFTVLDSFFDELLASGKCTCDSLYIMTTGHSLGGATAEVTHLHLAERYGSCGATNDAVAFAPAHALSDTAAARVAEIGNIRSLVYEMDAVPFFPCHQDTGMPRCNPELNVFAPGTGRDDYGMHVNQITITQDWMSDIDERYSNTDFLDIDISIIPPGVTVSSTTPANLELGAAHVCSYGCWAATTGCQISTWLCDNCPSLPATTTPKP